MLLKLALLSVFRWKMPNQISTWLPERRVTAPSQGANRACREARVERAFRSIKTVDLSVRPVFHYGAQSVRAHVFLCMLARRATEADAVR